MESGYRKMQELLKMVPDTDAVFCVTDSIAQGAMAALADNKKAVPDQVRLAGMGDAPLSRMALPQTRSGGGEDPVRADRREKGYLPGCADGV